MKRAARIALIVTAISLVLVLATVGILAGTMSGPSTSSSNDALEESIEAPPAPLPVAPAPAPVQVPQTLASDQPAVPRTEELPVTEETFEEDEPEELEGTGTDEAAAEECERRIADNETLFEDALEEGTGASFHCNTRCVSPSAMELRDSEADDVEGFQDEVRSFVSDASTAAEAAEEGEDVCFVEAGEGRRSRGASSGGGGAMLPENSALNEPSADRVTTSLVDPQADAPTVVSTPVAVQPTGAATRRSDPFIPEEEDEDFAPTEELDAFEEDVLPGESRSI